MTPADIVREVFPKADDAFIEHVVWGRTGFPGFFALKEGQTVEDKMREQLIEFRTALDLCPKGKRLCDHCNNFVSKAAWHCISCDWNRCFDLDEI